MVECRTRCKSIKHVLDQGFLSYVSTAISTATIRSWSWVCISLHHGVSSSKAIDITGSTSHIQRAGSEEFYSQSFRVMDSHLFAIEMFSIWAILRCRSMARKNLNIFCHQKPLL